MIVLLLVCRDNYFLEDGCTTNVRLRLLASTKPRTKTEIYLDGKLRLHVSVVSQKICTWRAETLKGKGREINVEKVSEEILQANLIYVNSR